MKYIACLASLATAQAAQHLSEFINAKFEEVVTYNKEDGTANVDLSPYLVLDASDYGRIGTLTHSLAGGKQDEDNWNIDYESGKFDIHLNGVSHGINMAAWGFKVGEIVNHVNYDQKMTIEYGAGGVSVVGDKNLDVKLNVGTQGSINEDVSLKVDFETTGVKAKASLNLEASRTSENLESFKGYKAYYFSVPYDVNVDASVAVNDVNKCSADDIKSMKGCTVKFESEATVNEESYKAGASLGIKPYAIVIKAQAGGAAHLAFVRQTDRNNKAVALDFGNNYVELYYAKNQVNWQKALKQKFAKLILRSPTAGAFSKHANAELQELAEPFIDFGMACIQRPERIPYAAYYIDEIFEGMNANQFNCADFIEETRIESEVIASAYKTVSINSAMQNYCLQVNNQIVSALKSDELDNAMHTMRNYNEVMSSDAGHAEFEQIFGGKIV